MKEKMIAKVPFNYILVTANEKPKSEAGLIVNIDNSCEDKQRVLAVGPNVPKDIEVNDIIKINWIAHTKPDWDREAAPSAIDRETTYKQNFKVFPPYCDVEGLVCLKITDRDIDYYIKQKDLATQVSRIKTPKIIK